MTAWTPPNPDISPAPIQSSNLRQGSHSSGHRGQAGTVTGADVGSRPKPGQSELLFLFFFSKRKWDTAVSHLGSIWNFRCLQSFSPVPERANQEAKNKNDLNQDTEKRILPVSSPVIDTLGGAANEFSFCNSGAALLIWMVISTLVSKNPLWEYASNEQILYTTCWTSH